MSKQKMTVKTKDAVEMYKILNAARYNKLEDADKIKLWKIVRALKPIATKYDEDVRDASDKFTQEVINFQENYKKAMAYETDKLNGKKELPMTDEEYNNFRKDFLRVNKLVEDAVKEYSEADVEVEFEKISEDAFGKLMASNDWTVEQVTKVDFII